MVVFICGGVAFSFSIWSLNMTFINVGLVWHKIELKHLNKTAILPNKTATLGNKTAILQLLGKFLISGL
nr:hypothetical protein [Mucilaginibacter sp. FT3.2]